MERSYAFTDWKSHNIGMKMQGIRVRDCKDSVSERATLNIKIFCKATVVTAVTLMQQNRLKRQVTGPHIMKVPQKIDGKQLKHKFILVPKIFKVHAWFFPNMCFL